LTADEYREVERAADALVLDVSSYARSILLRVSRNQSVSLADMQLPSKKKSRQAHT